MLINDGYQSLVWRKPESQLIFSDSVQRDETFIVSTNNVERMRIADEGTISLNGTVSVNGSKVVTEDRLSDLLEQIKSVCAENELLRKFASSLLNRDYTGEANDE